MNFPAAEGEHVLLWATFYYDIPVNSTPGFSDETWNNFRCCREKKRHHYFRDNHTLYGPTSSEWILRRQGGVIQLHTQLEQSLTVSSIQQREGHELTPEEAEEGLIIGVTKHMVLHFPWCSARQQNRGALYLSLRMYSLCNNRAPAPLRGPRVTAPKHWNRTAPQSSRDRTQQPASNCKLQLQKCKCEDAEP